MNEKVSIFQTHSLCHALKLVAALRADCPEFRWVLGADYLGRYWIESITWGGK